MPLCRCAGDPARRVLNPGPSGMFIPPVYCTFSSPANQSKLSTVPFPVPSILFSPARPVSLSATTPTTTGTPHPPSTTPGNARRDCTRTLVYNRIDNQPLLACTRRQSGVSNQLYSPIPNTAVTRRFRPELFGNLDLRQDILLQECERVWRRELQLTGAARDIPNHGERRREQPAGCCDHQVTMGYPQTHCQEQWSQADLYQG